MRFCPQCGAPLMSGAKFCVECGSVLAGTASGAGESGNLRGSADRGRNIPITTAFVVVFVAITVVGLAAAAWIMMRTPEAVREQAAVANVPGAGAPNAAAPEQNVTANPAAGEVRAAPCRRDIRRSSCRLRLALSLTRPKKTRVRNPATWRHGTMRGPGHYVGTAMGWGINNNGWWGEGEIKFYLDGDGEFPTICGTGTEDYFGGSYDWEVDGQYVTYSTPFLGMHQVRRPDGCYQSQQRHAMYRWHIMDPIRFQQDLRVTMQALGWRTEGRYYPGQHDMCSTAYWYQMLPTAQFPELPDRNALEVV